MHALESVDTAQQLATEWLWLYNDEEFNRVFDWVAPGLLLQAAVFATNNCRDEWRECSFCVSAGRSLNVKLCRQWAEGYSGDANDTVA